MELMCFVVKRSGEPVDISRLRRDRRKAWELYLNESDPDENRFQRMIWKASDMDGVRLHCYRLVPSGTSDTL
jgi:hypothetical protein